MCFTLTWIKWSKAVLIIVQLLFLLSSGHRVLVLIFDQNQDDSHCLTVYMQTCSCPSISFLKVISHVLLYSGWAAWFWNILLFWRHDILIDRSPLYDRHIRLCRSNIYYFHKFFASTVTSIDEQGSVWVSISKTWGLQWSQILEPFCSYRLGIFGLCLSRICGDSRIAWPVTSNVLLFPGCFAGPLSDVEHAAHPHLLRLSGRQQWGRRRDHPVWQLWSDRAWR